MIETKEIFKDITDYEPYQISNFGRVLNKATGKFIKPAISQFGYHRVKLFQNRKRTYHSVHRLVALYFIDNPNGYPLVLHNNNIPYDNRVENLLWGTSSDNNIQAIKEGRRKSKIGVKRPDQSGENNPRAHFTNLQILVVRDAVKNGHSLTKIGRYFKTTKGTIWKIKAGYSYASV